MPLANRYALEIKNDKANICHKPTLLRKLANKLSGGCVPITQSLFNNEKSYVKIRAKDY